MSTRTKWLNGTVLHYCFFTGNSHFAVPKAQADAVREAFATWMKGNVLEVGPEVFAERVRGLR